MESLNFFGISNDVFVLFVLPLMIFCARILDQTVGTLRLIFVSKGFKSISALLGFFEALIWLIAISQIIQNLNNVASFIAYGLGFAVGNYVGIWLEDKISIGTVVVRIIPRSENAALIDKLRESNFGFTSIDASGSMGRVKMIFSIVKRKDAKHLISLINEYNPNSFYTIEDVKSVNQGVFRSSSKSSFFRFNSGLRKMK